MHFFSLFFCIYGIFLFRRPCQFVRQGYKSTPVQAAVYWDRLDKITYLSLTGAVIICISACMVNMWYLVQQTVRNPLTLQKGADQKPLHNDLPTLLFPDMFPISSKYTNYMELTTNLSSYFVTVKKSTLNPIAAEFVSWTCPSLNTEVSIVSFRDNRTKMHIPAADCIWSANSRYLLDHITHRCTAWSGACIVAKHFQNCHQHSEH